MKLEIIFNNRSVQQGMIEPVNPKHWRQNCLYLILQQSGDTI